VRPWSGSQRVDTAENFPATVRSKKVP